MSHGRSLLLRKVGAWGDAALARPGRERSRAALSLRASYAEPSGAAPKLAATAPRARCAATRPPARPCWTPASFVYHDAREVRAGARREALPPRTDRMPCLRQGQIPCKGLHLRPIPAPEVRSHQPAAAVGDSGHAYVMTLGESVDLPAGSEQFQISCRGPGVDETRRESAARGVCTRSLASVRIRGC